jgi:hypothetical protein
VLDQLTREMVIDEWARARVAGMERLTNRPSSEESMGLISGAHLGFEIGN